MPIYEYRCQKCGRTFEVLQRINEEPLQHCIHCGGEVEKLISASSFQFKGSGWYVTDYSRRQKSPDNGSSEKKDAKETSVAKDTKTGTENVNKK
ncbi:MAG TPA: zinc ribbon domain-containing protein [Candidatus Aminicenantes bacterium]|nr:zinc ribbon domain-containing protein [Candidatus Aminicenantes bacterium]